jgi:hypothetical protein
MQFNRYMDARTFTRELERLRAFCNEYVGTGLLESLEAAQLLLPRLRIRYPDPIARRFWLIRHEHENPQAELRYHLQHIPEPDSARWDAAVALRNAMYRWQKYLAYGVSTHPLDDPEPRFAQFIEQPTSTPFIPWMERRVDVSNNIHETLFDDLNVENYYTTWQLLQAAESADAGVHYRMNLADEDISQLAENLHQGKAPEARWSMNFVPVHAVRGFVEYERALDAVVWFSEERNRALNDIVKNERGRFRMNQAQSEQYDRATSDVAQTAMAQRQVGIEDLIASIRFLSERWSVWHANGRPLIADAYKDFLEQAVILSRRHDELSFNELRDRIGQVGGWSKPILDVIWPNWAEEEKERARLTLKAAMTPEKTEVVADTDINAFVEFLAQEGLEAFFWRLRSFEDHALRGNENALEGMRSDIQGMSVAVEHIAGALGASETQLYKKFKQLWRDPDVLAILNRGTVSPLARQERLARDWPALKSKIEALRLEKGGRIAADLVMAHRIRGGVHAMLPEDDHFELEAMFVSLMRAALYTFIEVRRPPTQAVGGTFASPAAGKSG